VASFANMLGGWLLLGVNNDGTVVRGEQGNPIGYRPPGRADLQDHIRQLLGPQVDPLPPFAAVTVEYDGAPIGVVRVAESSDTPHVTSKGVIYQRTPGGKEPVTEARDILALARRGENARRDAEKVRLFLPLIEFAMDSPEQLVYDTYQPPGFVVPPVRQGHKYDDDDLLSPEVLPDIPPPPPILEWIVRAAPYTVTGAFADRALSGASAELANQEVISLFSDEAGVAAPATAVEPLARGLRCWGAQVGSRRQADLAIDAGGAIAVRYAWRSNAGTLTLSTLPDDVLCALVRVVADVLAGLDGYGRAAVALQVRHADQLFLGWKQQHARVKPESLIDGWQLHIGGELAIPADDADVRELADRWTREFARAAGLPIWEPQPKAPQPDTP
jgi:hypothetical protein